MNELWCVCLKAKRKNFVITTNGLAIAWLMFRSRFIIEIKDLDGERKALVYDNYSKLIAAADTIGKVCTYFLGSSL